MDCPKCGKWNPDDKRICWHCQTELPKPVEKKKRRAGMFMGLPVWAWAMLAVLLVLWLSSTCLGPALVNK